MRNPKINVMEFILNMSRKIVIFDSWWFSRTPSFFAILLLLLSLHNNICNTGYRLTTGTTHQFNNNIIPWYNDGRWRWYHCRAGLERPVAASAVAVSWRLRDRPRHGSLDGYGGGGRWRRWRGRRGRGRRHVRV